MKGDAVSARWRPGVWVEFGRRRQHNEGMQGIESKPSPIPQPTPPVPIPMLLWCPECGARHIDEGAFANVAHHTHACQDCGMQWRPALVPTCGVRFLPGCKNDGTDAPPDGEARFEGTTGKLAEPQTTRELGRLLALAHRDLELIDSRPFDPGAILGNAVAKHFREVVLRAQLAKSSNHARDVNTSLEELRGLGLEGPAKNV